MRKNFISPCTLILLSFLLSFASQAQKHKPGYLSFPEVTAKDFEPNVYSIDSSADAVYLANAATTWYEGNDKGWFSVHFKTFVRIRLLNKKSFGNLASQKLYLLNTSDYQEKLLNFEATTYNLSNGNITKTKVDKASFYKEKSGFFDINKFTFPDIKEGSIIEFKYEKEIPSDYINSLPGWSFQKDYPQLRNEYTVEIPSFFDYVLLNNGYLKPDVDTVSSSNDVFTLIFREGAAPSSTSSLSSTTLIHKWVYNNVPALKEANYISNLEDYRQKIEFQLYAQRFPERPVRFFLNGWDEWEKKLMDDPGFGEQLTLENGWLNDDIHTAAGDEKDPLQRAKKIYEYVRDNYTCINDNARFLSQTLKQTAKLKKGSVVDINMLLAVMLHQDKFNVCPVILSTRDHGKAPLDYPIMDKFNYVIAKTEIAGHTYLLDASDPQLGFGKLDNSCYNDYGRAIADPPVVVPLLADSLTEGRVTTAFVTNDEDGKISGRIITNLGDMPSIMMRREMKKMSSDEYFQEVKKSYNFDVNISNGTIDSLNLKDEPVSVSYDISFKPEEDILYFNPMFSENIADNPFSAVERNFPVEMPYCPDKTFILNMEVPKGYVVDELPKPARVSLNESEGMFEYLIASDGAHIQLQCRLKLNKAIFEPEDYETLRQFYSFVTEKEGEQIVFKKQ